MMKYDSNFTPSDRAADIRARIPLSAIVAEYVDLTRAGNELKGCCPFHADHTPSFYVNDRKGQYHCFGCEAGGDVIKFVQEIEGVSFTEACDRLDDGFIPAWSTPPTPRPSGSKSIEFAGRIWRDAKPIEGTPAELYLANRCLLLDELPKQEGLRFDRLSFAGSATLHPTLIAAVRDVDGKLTGIHRTYLTEEGGKLHEAKAKRSLGEIKGSAIRLHGDLGNPDDHPHHLCLCEGLEDGLSAARMRDDPYMVVWACAGAGMMQSIKLPNWCEYVTIAVDNDPIGQQAGRQLLRRLAASGIAGRLWEPDPLYKDLNEQLQAGLQGWTPGDEDPWAFAEEAFQ